MKIKIIPIGYLQTNCYLVSAINGDTLIIDPGDEAEKIKQAIEKEKLQPKLIINTHSHYDHVGANASLASYYNIATAMHEDGKMFAELQKLRINRWLKDHDLIQIGPLVFEVLETPGHDASAICLYNKEENVLFSGDTLFAGDIGRTDLPGSSPQKMRQSLKRIFNLPSQTLVYPGHGEQTTIENEKMLLSSGL